MESRTKLQQQVDALEKRLERVEQQLSSARPTGFLDTTTQHDATTHPVVYQKTAVDIAIGKFFTWVKTDWLMKLGAFLLLLAVAWFVNFAFVNNWVGPTGRIVLGMLVGALFCVFGYVQMPKYDIPGQVLSATGGVMMLVTLFAARHVYAMFTPLVTLFFMGAVIAVLAVLAVMRKKSAIAYLALLGGAIVPFLIDAPTTDYTGLVTYILLLNIGVFSVVAVRGWRHLVLAALGITVLYTVFSFPHMPEATVWIYMTLFFSIFFASTISAILFHKQIALTDLFVFPLNGLVLLWWILEFAPKEGSSAVLIFVAALLLFVSFLLKKVKGIIQPVYLSAALAVIYIGTATAIEFDGAALTIAYILEAFSVFFLAHLCFKNRVITESLCWLYSLPVLLSLEYIFEYPTEGVLFHNNFFILLLLLGSMVGTSVVLRTYDGVQGKSVRQIFYTLSFVCFFTFVWLFLHNMIGSVNIARGIALVLYTIVGIALIYEGTYKKVSYLSTVGGVVIGGVVLRLLLVEVWDMALAGRIVTFLIIGVLLVSTAFMTKLVKKEA